jgi:hypothetical protein
MSAIEATASPASGVYRVVEEVEKPDNLDSDPGVPCPIDLKAPEDSYWEQLVRYNSKLGKDELQYPEFASLQRLNIIHLHNALAEIKADIWQRNATSKEQMADLKAIMHDYGIELPAKDISSQFLISSSHSNQRHRIPEQSQPHEPTSLHKPPDFSRARLPKHCFSDRRPL